MLKLLITGLALVATVACSPAASTSTLVPTSTPDPELQTQADLRAIEQLEVTFHKAASTKDIELMMSIWADNGTLVLGAQTYTGKVEIRDFWLTKSGPFKPENHWEGDTPAYKIVATVDGDKGTLYYECHFIDVATRTVASATSSNQSVARINGVWLITNAVGGTALLSP